QLQCSSMRPLLYYITERKQFSRDSKEQERRLLDKIVECTAAGVDYIQLREKDLSTRALEELANKATAALAGSQTKLLINSRTDVALACGAHGVHLPSNDLPASEVRAIFSVVNQARVNTAWPIIGVSAHSAAEVAYAEAHGADFAVFAPVFAKGSTANPEGLERLRQICSRSQTASSAMPVFALGGITLQNAHLCLEAGAQGIAGIRLFQANNAHLVVRKVRGESMP
ncbi:MAG TPA: thiamine phosphate synthase, partial [Candidatus Angelobacter sp.]|nr:thiamine phosphate synthase [Candidatus Angelobacter sp.]